MVSFQRPSWSPFACSDFSSSFPPVRPDFHEAYGQKKDNSAPNNPSTTFQALDFAQLRPFETVTDQFKSIGVQFEDAIALQPSNPIFWTHKREIVLMPTTARQSVRVLFQNPVNQACISVIGVQEIKMIATLGDRPPLVQRSPKPNRAFRTPNDLLDPLMPYHLELNGELSTDIILESTHPFVISAFLFGFTQNP